MSTSSSRDVLDRVDREKATYLEELKEFIRIPSVSTDPAYREQVLACADHLESRLRDAGLETEQLSDGEGYPLVYGEWLGAPGKPTVLFYGHYDVQPVDPIELWRHDPFEPTEEGDHLVARGATDDKGQCYTHVKAVAAMLAERGSLPVNVKFVIEGEEESGGEAIERYVRKDAGDKLAADCVVISDSAMFAPGQPSLLYGLKGLAYFELKVTGPNRDLHSGSFGGAVTNPLNALGRIVDRLRDGDTGTVLIPGFYDDVRPLEAWEREEFGKLPFDAAAYQAELGVPELFGEEGYTTFERVWGRPTCDLNGIYGGYMGEGAKTVLPSWAGAKVSMRLVPDQDPETVEKQLQAYVEDIKPPGVTVEVKTIHGGKPVLLETEGPLVDAALGAMTDIWQKPVRVREGGSIPIVQTFSEVLEVPILLLGFGLSDDRLHSPNEKFNISNFYGGIRAIVRMLDRMGSLS